LKRLMLFVGLTMLFLIGTIAIVHCSPGISVSIVDKNRYITSPSGTATFIVNVTSITTQDENLSLTVSGDSHLGFNWTSEDFILPAGATKLFGLSVTNPGGGSGVLNFTASAEAWPVGMTHDQAASMGLIETSSYQDYVQIITVTPLAATISPLSASISVGQSVHFTSNESGGLPPYTDRWYLNGAVVSGPGANLIDWTFTPAQKGTYYVWKGITDNTGTVCNSTHAQVTVLAAPSVGGYSFSIEGLKPLTLYLLATVILATAFATIKHKKPRNSHLYKAH
jgi:hypothetical protein